jgi:ketosteroid isomerase-like protein
VSEEVESLRAVYDAFNRRDFEDLVQHMHPEVEAYPGVVGFDVKRRYHGRAGIREFFETILETFDEYTVEPEEIVEVSDERVLAVEHWRVRGRGGVEVDTQIIDLWKFRDGLIVRVDGFRDKAEALEAAGLAG